MFLKGEVDAVDILFPRFINTLTQQPQTVPFLPIGKTCRRDRRRECARPGAARRQRHGRVRF